MVVYETKRFVVKQNLNGIYKVYKTKNKIVEAEFKFYWQAVEYAKRFEKLLESCFPSKHA